MEKDKRTNRPEKASKSIADIGIGPKFPRRPSSYDMLQKTDPEHRLVKEYDAALKEYREYWDKIHAIENKAIPEEPEPKKLVEANIKSVYEVFKQKFFELHGVVFDYKANNGESKQLAYTLLYYFFRDKRFLKSPLLNQEINNPDLKKGIAVFGGYGCGKTSIFKAIRKLFFDAVNDESIVVKDVDGDEIPLKRYRRIFAYYTANEVVRMYESCRNEEQKERFWTVMTTGEAYFDDLTTEREASNYGKVEIFKDIIEERYEKSSRTLISLNYNGTTTETLESMGERYGSRVYDRTFEMYNIIELKGKSLRN